MDNTKIRQYKSRLSFREFGRKIAEFTELTDTNYRPESLAKKQQAVENNPSIYVSTKHIPI